MKISQKLISAFMAILLSVATLSQAQTVENSIVHIVCDKKDGTGSTNGSGVVISRDGHVLTAKHVVKETTNCKGSLGVAIIGGGGLRLDPLGIVVPDGTDVEMYQIASAAPDFEFAPYCELKSWMVRREIFVAGFPARTDTGAPSFRLGVLSKVRPNKDGLLQTDGQTARGMSGGPVFSQNLSGLVGLVVGSEDADKDGEVDYYGVLSIAHLARNIPELKAANRPCYRKSRTVALPAGKTTWETGDTDKELGVTEEEGICFLTRVHGNFNNKGDAVGVEVVDGEYVLKGENKDGATHGGSARCMWFN